MDCFAWDFAAKVSVCNVCVFVVRIPLVPHRLGKVFGEMETATKGRGGPALFRTYLD